MSLNYTRSPEQIIVDQINIDNTHQVLTVAELSFGAPTAGSFSGKDTKVTVTAVNGQGYKDARDIFYNRVDLANAAGALSTEFALGSAVNLSDLIPSINARYGINLTAADYTDVAIPAFPGSAPHETETLDIVAKATSLVWKGQLTITIDANDISLTTAIPNNTLSGLVYTPPA